MKNGFVIECIRMVLVTIIRLMHNTCMIAVEVLEITKEIGGISRKKMRTTEMMMQRFITVIIFKMLDLMMSTTMEVVADVIRIMYRTLHFIEIMNAVEMTGTMLIILVAMHLQILSVQAGTTIVVCIAITAAFVIETNKTGAKKNAARSLLSLADRYRHILSSPGLLCKC